MAVSHVGRGLVWGITTTGMEKNGVAITNASAIVYQSQSLTRNTDSTEHKDGNGEVVGLTTYNQSQDLEVECYPTGTTAGTATADARTLRNLLPNPGDRVTMLDTVDASDPIKTDFICTGASYRKSNSDKAIITLTLKRYTGITSYAAVS